MFVTIMLHSEIGMGKNTLYICQLKTLNLVHLEWKGAKSPFLFLFMYRVK